MVDSRADSPANPIQTSGAAASLLELYRNRFLAARNQPRPVAGYTSNTVPWELLWSAGFFPILLSPPLEPSPLANGWMENVFPDRIRATFHRLTSDGWDFLKLVAIPRTSEQEHKLFLYLREFQRQNPEAPMPELVLYNLLHTRSPEAEAYGFKRTLDLKRRLEEILGRAVTDDRLREAIGIGNRARAAARELQRLRTSRKICGTEAFPLLGAFYFADRVQYAGLLAELIAKRDANAPLSGPRLLIKGSPLDHPELHRQIESHGAIVVAEDDWRGARAAGCDIATDIDPLQAIFEKYYRDAASPRVFPQEENEHWFRKTSLEADGVVFYLPPEDDVWGWEYPRQRAFLDSRGIPHLLIRGDAGRGLSSEDHDRIRQFVKECAGGRSSID